MRCECVCVVCVLCVCVVCVCVCVCVYVCLSVLCVYSVLESAVSAALTASSATGVGVSSGTTIARWMLEKKECENQQRKETIKNNYTKNSM